MSNKRVIFTRRGFIKGMSWGPLKILDEKGWEVTENGRGPIGQWVVLHEAWSTARRHGVELEIIDQV